MTYGQTDDFPAFYTPKSGFKVRIYPVMHHAVDRFHYVSEPLESG